MLDAQEYTELRRKQAAEKKEDIEIIILVIAVLIVPVLVILPWREVNIPKPVLITMALALGFVCAKFAAEEFPKLIIVYAVYAPFSKVLAGDFDNVMTAFNLTNVFLVFMVGGWLARGMVHGKTVYRRRPLDIPLGLFMLLSSMSLLRAGFFGAGFIEFSTKELVLQLKRWLFPMFLYFVAVNTIDKKKHLRWLIYAVSVTVFAVAVLGLKEYYLDKNAGAGMREVKKRISVGSGPNNLGAFFCYYSPFIFAFFLTKIRNFRAWTFEFPAYIACMQAMRLTFSRGAQLGFAAVTLFCIYLKKRAFFFVIIVPMIVMMTIMPQLIPKRCYGRLGKTYNPDKALAGGSMEMGLDKSSYDRIVIWKGGLRIVRDHPFLGVGYKNFPQVIGEYLHYQHGYIKRDPHNTYLSIAAEMGLPTLVVFLWVMFIMLRTGLWVYRHTEDRTLKIYSMGYCGGMIGLLITNIFGSRLDSAEITAQFWLLTGGIFVAREFVAKEIEQREKEIEDSHQVTPFSVEKEI